MGEKWPLESCANTPLHIFRTRRLESFVLELRSHLFHLCALFISQMYYLVFFFLILLISSIFPNIQLSYICTVFLKHTCKHTKQEKIHRLRKVSPKRMQRKRRNLRLRQSGNIKLRGSREPPLIRRCCSVKPLIK